MRGPDFIVIGAIKGGSTWLYDQTRAHPNCWPTPFKEIHYFNQARRSNFPLPKMEAWAVRGAHGETDPAARAFFNAILMCSGRPLSVDLYAELFAPKGDKVAGDVSPGYAGLDSATIETVAKGLPETKFVYLAREPISRAWSHMSMRARDGVFKPRVFQFYGTFCRYMNRPEMQLASYPSRIVTRWAQHLGPDRFRVFPYENTRRDPARQRRDIFDFIGLDPEAAVTVQADYNRKEGRRKLVMTPRVEGFLRAYLGEECAAWEALKVSSLASYMAPEFPENESI